MPISIGTTPCLRLVAGVSFFIAICHQTSSFAELPNKTEPTTNQLSISSLWSTPGNLYIALAAGASFSTNASVAVSTTYWDLYTDGYGGNLGNSEVLGASIGYVINPLLRFELGVDHRNSFNYHKHQSTPTVSRALINWGPRERYFDVSNTTVMATAFMNGSGISHHMMYQGSGYIIDPFIGAGLGGAFNTLDNLHSTQVGVFNVLSNNRAFSIMSASNTVRTFAYQFSAGFDVKTNRKLALGLGYRYLNAGNVVSSNYLTDNSNNVGITSGVVVPPWRAVLRCNEVYVTLKYAMN